MGKAAGGQRRGSVLRRGSVVSVAVPKLARRMELQRCFDTIKDEGRDTVDRRRLCTAIQGTVDTMSLFTPEQFEALNNVQEGSEISWVEFLAFIQACERGYAPKTVAATLDTLEETEENAAAGGGGGGMGSERDDRGGKTPEPLPELVPRQSRALEVEMVGKDQIAITSLDVDDIRILVGRGTKLVVNSNDDALDIVSTYVDREKLPEAAIPVLFDHVEKSIIRASNQEIGKVNECVMDCLEQLEAMAEQILASEEKMLAAVEDFKRMEFQQKHLTAARRGSAIKEIEASMGLADEGAAPATTAQLALKLTELQDRVAAAQIELDQLRVKQQKQTHGEQTKNADVVRAERDAWRKQMDAKLAMIKLSNEQRMVMVRENNVLRTTVDCIGKEGKLEEVRSRFVAERQRRMEYINELQSEVTQLEAELHMSQKEFDVAIHRE